MDVPRIGGLESWSGVLEIKARMSPEKMVDKDNSDEGGGGGAKE